ncbi:MAG: putative sulfate exporter family transporter [Varibaculum cambriense]|nr:putative sulfate exporter family transporter [Varibaculum cambriense]MDU5542541.1 putative sulfate exporter family transporter [Varibaculum cambriense]
MNKFKRLLPGIAYACLIAGIAWLINLFLPLLSSMLVAILLGVAVRNTKLIPAVCEPGISFSAKTILRSGVVLLGFRLSLPAIAALGTGTIVTIICAVAVTMVAGYLLTYFMRVSHATGILTTSGTAICGASAVAGISPVVSARSREDADDAVATAIACVTLFGTLSLVALPAAAHGLGLSPTQAAVWLGASIHEVGQVVAAANIYDPAISDLATATKLGRVACLAIVVAIVGIVERRVVEVRHEQAEKTSSGKRPPLIPGFVVGFLIAVALASVFAGIPTVNNIFSTLGGTVATLLLTVAMGAMGAGVNLRNVIKSGGRALVLGIILSVLIAAVSLGSVLLLVD